MASRIRAIRKAKDMSGTFVAEKLGISAQYYYDIEKGKRNLSANMARKLAEIFGVSTDYLLGRTDDMGIVREDDSSEDEEDIRTIERAARKMSDEDRKKAIQIMKLTFEYAFEEDDEDDEEDI